MDLIDVADAEYRLRMDATEDPEVVEITAIVAGGKSVTVDVRISELEDALLAFAAERSLVRS